MDQGLLVTLTSDIVSAHVANNKIAISDVPELVRNVHRALAAVGQTVQQPAGPRDGVVSVRASVRPEYLVCLKCGAKQSMLRRHIRTAHAMTPEQYRQEFGLKPDYPMIASDYAARRADIARASGLGLRGVAARQARAAGQMKAVEPVEDEQAA